MYNIPFGKSGMNVPTLAVGCMRIANMQEKQADEFVDTALENGANFFDHADIYGRGKSETVFSKAIARYDREKVILQSKCGIVSGKMFDFSYDHIVSSVDGILQRLNTDYLDVLLLHRPDALMEPEEVAKAFSHLKDTGKVRHFGVSNQNPYQMQLLQSCLDMPLCANQIQMSIMHAPTIQAGINVNMYNDPGVNRDGGILDFCRLNKITPQAWSPLQFGFFEGCFLDNERFPKLNETLGQLAEKYGVTKTSVAINWLLRHPAKIQPVTGTTNPQRLTECCRATEFTMTREEWYAIYQAAGNVLP
jgi:predicted oxidoreductase